MAKKKHLHEKLGITFQELGALLGVRVMLESGLLQYAPPPDRTLISWRERVKPGEHLFNMGVVDERQHCGSIGCIGGSMAMLMGCRDPNGYVREGGESGNLRRLFYPSVSENGRFGTDKRYRDITAKETIRAIDNYLKTGNPNWKEACGGK